MIFNIIDADPTTAGEYAYWDGMETINLLNKGDREIVLAIVRSAVAILVSEIRPAEIRIFTHDANLPVKAMRKFQALVDVLISHAYDVQIGAPYHGQQQWIARRAPD